MQVSDAVASQQQNLSQADNSTYLMESFHKLVHDLEEPLGVRPASHPNAPSRPVQSARRAARPPVKSSVVGPSRPRFKAE